MPLSRSRWLRNALYGSQTHYLAQELSMWLINGARVGMVKGASLKRGVSY